jgi:hypothetical protein
VSEEGEDGDVELDSRTKREVMQEERRQKRWGWYSCLHRLAGGDLTKFEEIAEMNLITCLNHLSYLKENNI